MKVDGTEAAGYDAVNLSSMLRVNQGTLVTADEDTGYVLWTDSTGNNKSVSLGQHTIKIVRAGR